MNWLEKRIVSKRNKIEKVQKAKNKIDKELRVLKSELKSLEELTVNQMNMFTGKRYE